jgi:ribosomal protein S6E (S10)
MPWAGVEYVPGVAKTGDPFLAQGMGINARRLRRHIGANTHHPPGQLIGELEGLKLQIVSGSGKQGFEIFNERWDYQLVAPALAGIHYIPTQGFDPSGQRGKNILYPVWQ